MNANDVFERTSRICTNEDGLMRSLAAAACGCVRAVILWVKVHGL